MAGGNQRFQERIRELESRLAEAEQTTEAIRGGEVDALVVDGGDGAVVYTLRGADEPYRLLVERMAEGAATLNPDGLILFSNRQLAAIVDLPLQRVVGSLMQDLVHPEALPLFQALLAARESASFELSLRRADGELVPVYLSTAPLELDGVSCVTLVVTDLTGQKRDQEILAAGQFASSILEQVATPILVLDGGGTIVKANPAAERLAGAPVLLRHFSEVFPLRCGRDGRALTLEEILATGRRRGSIGLEALAGAPGGETVNVVVNANLLAAAENSAHQFIVSISDISDLRRAEEALRESEGRERARAAELQAILEAAPVALFVGQDAECRSIMGNRMGHELLRIPPGVNTSKSAPPDQAPTHFQVFRNGRELSPSELPVQQAALSGRPVRDDEVDLVFDDGTSRTLLAEAVPLVGDDGRPRGAVGAFVDITERKRTQERLRQAQKLESVGLLAGGIAHDFNNLLTGILGNASLVLGQADQATAERMRDIISSGERAADLTRQLLAYAGKGQFVVQDVNVAGALNSISALVQSSIPPNVQLSVTSQARLPLVRMDPAHLHQIVVNLVMNAGEAIGGRQGSIGLTTAAEDVRERFTDAMGEEVPPGRYLTIEVTDTGEGIPTDKRPHIFDPFFTTRFTGRGLGLAAVAGIVRSLKGGIAVASEPGRGSTFRVYLPATGPVERPRPASVATARASILVVDDEPAVRDFIEAALVRQGYRVLLAANGRDALTVCEREADAIDAAIVDLVMPLMGGQDLLPLLNARHPRIRILLTSGYSEGEARRLTSAYPGVAFIQKPYTGGQILRAVGDLLRGEGGLGAGVSQ